MDLTADALGYSYGYCANVESAAIKQLVQKEEVMLLINFASERDVYKRQVLTFQEK